MLATTVSFAVLAFVAGSVFYVYRLRGNERYAGFKEYVRKGWPIFSPLNCLLYLFTQSRARRPIVDLERFPELEPIRRNWRTIADEAKAVRDRQCFEDTADPESSAYYDLGFRTFYKYGWRKFYLTWYGYTHASAQRLCPQTVRILEATPGVNGAMLSILPAGGKLTRHCDPFACSMRYHLGLATPNDDACYINIDGTDYSWRDGQAMMFDETCLHYAHNDSDSDRLILMCDVERPTVTPGPLINFVYKGLMRLTVVPNTGEDKRGLANAAFASLSPTLAQVRGLKQTNPGRYAVIKYSVNTTLALLVFGLVGGALVLIAELLAVTNA